MLSLILEGKDDWELYYHTKISATALQTIQAQAEKLADSVQWDGRIQFLDDGTMKRVKEIWRCYQAGTDLKPSLMIRKKFVGEDVSVSSGVRSAAPFVYHATLDLPKLHKKFWKDGTVEDFAKYPNPLFFSSSIMHYGSDPLSGFHLALAYAPIKDGAKGPVAAAKAEFASWSKSFRKSRMTIKYCWADALSFCDAIQGIQGHRSSYSTDLLVLENQLFDMIDTSNLADHLSAINVMLASSPLLRPDSLLRMELLVMKNQPKKVLDELLNGDLLTISSLLGLSLIEYGTNASASSTVDTLILDEVMKPRKSNGHDVKQVLLKFTWKAVPAIVLDTKQLANVLYALYQSMFEHESISKRMGNLSTEENLKRLQLFPYFHRGSYAHFLRSVQGSSTDWQAVVDRLLELIESDRDVLLTGQYMQELYLYLHSFGLFTTDVIKNPLSVLHVFPRMQDFWSSSPGIVWLTIRVPRSNLRHFASHDVELGSIPVHGIVESATKQFQNFFASIQMVFGNISTTGSMDTLDIQITEDPSGLKGTAPMFVSFRIPSWILMVEQDKTVIGFGAQSTVHTVRILSRKLGLELKIFMTNLGNSSNVFITKNPPNNSGKNSAEVPSYLARSDRNIKGIIADHKLHGMVARVDVKTEDEKIALLAGSEVTTHQVTPWRFELTFAGYRHEVKLPAPASITHCKTRIARKSAYLELVASPLSAEDCCTMSPFPISYTPTGIELVNMPRVSLDTLPVLNIGGNMDWLNPHISMSFSASERALRDTGLETTKNPRVNFKDSIFSLYMMCGGGQGRNNHARVNGLVNEASQGLAVVIFVDKLRLDLSGRTVLMDVAILPILKPANMRIGRVLESLVGHRMCYTKVGDAELEIWNQVLPAFIERCRTWSHSDTCEYRKLGKVPLSYGPNEQFFCTCGNGKFPEDYLRDVPEWSELACYCVRAAISPCFAVPYMDDLFNEGMLRRLQNVCRQCKKEDTNSSLKACGRCLLVKYCSSECQKKDWSKHKLICKK